MVRKLLILMNRSDIDSIAVTILEGTVEGSSTANSKVHENTITLIASTGGERTLGKLNIILFRLTSSDKTLFTKDTDILVLWTIEGISSSECSRFNSKGNYTIVRNV